MSPLCIFIAWYTLHLDVFAAECDPLGLVRLEALRADVDFLRSIHRFSTTSTSSTTEKIVVPFSSRTGTGPSTTRCIGTRDLDLLAPERLINERLAFVDHLAMRTLPVSTDRFCTSSLPRARAPRHRSFLRASSRGTGTSSATQGHVDAAILLGDHDRRHEVLLTILQLHAHVRGVTARRRRGRQHRPAPAILATHCC